MLDTKDFSFFESQNNFDFKGFLIKTLSYWKWFLLSWAIAFTIAYQINVRKERYIQWRLLCLSKKKAILFLLQIQVWFLIGAELKMRCKPFHQLLNLGLTMNWLSINFSFI
jgi:hypothetical protein